MKKFLIEIVCYFLFPAALIGVVAEYSLRKIPNDYAVKNEWLTRNSGDVQVIALGASSVLHDINPRYFQKAGFNAAHLSQSLKYDHFIFNKFIDQMQSLEYVIVAVDYWSPFGTIEESPEWWRVKYYNIHYGSNYYKWESRYNYELYFHDIGTFVNAAKGFLTLIGLRDESHRTVNEVGYGIHYTLENRSEEWDNGLEEASRHNKLIASALHSGLLDQNRGYVEDIIKKSEERDVKVILLNMPLYKSYREARDGEYVKIHNNFCRYFSDRYSHVMFHDFSGDPRFAEDDYYDANHLNEKGAEKFSLLLDSIMFHENTVN